MVAQKKYHGVVIPLVTPFDELGNIDRSSALKMMDLILRTETFPFILGTTGESASICWEKRVNYVEFIGKNIAGKTTLYAGISDNCVDKSIQVAKLYKELGVDVFVVHLPSYYPLNPEHIAAYFEKLADESPCPIMIYNIPGTTHMSIPIDVVDNLSPHPNIVGLKDSERSLERMKTLSDRFGSREDFSLLSGWTLQCAHALLSQFDGIVPSTGNLLPKLFQELYRATRENDADRAWKLQLKINPIAELHQKDRILSEVIPALKVMMHVFDLCDPYVLPPLMRLPEEDENRLRAAIKQLDITGYFSWDIENA
jgi:dihydrodipicolinate synthase/N-acetylneuraminate lyase